MERTLKGTIIYGDEFEPIEGYITIRDGIIKSIEESSITSNTIIAPCFINAHTHIGDSVLKDPPFLPLQELVQPPHGLKHRVLKNTSYSSLVYSMKASIKDMIKTGTCAFSDFREGGIGGAVALREALRNEHKIHATILGRPENGNMGYLDYCDGTGLSSTSDIDHEIAWYIANETKRKEKILAIHAGEKDTSDIPYGIALEPDILIHLTNAKATHIREIADKNIPVVICPRSNYITRSGSPPVEKMIEAGILVAIGTDNVMLNSVNMFSEMEFLVKTNLYDDRQVFKLCTLNGAKLLGMERISGSIKTGKKARLMVLSKKSDNMQGIVNPLSSLVRRARPDDIMEII